MGFLTANRRENVPVLAVAIILLTKKEQLYFVIFLYLFICTFTRVCSLVTLICTVMRFCTLNKGHREPLYVLFCKSTCCTKSKRYLQTKWPHVAKLFALDIEFE